MRFLILFLLFTINGQAFESCLEIIRRLEVNQPWYPSVSRPFDPNVFLRRHSSDIEFSYIRLVDPLSKNFQHFNEISIYYLDKKLGHFFWMEEGSKAILITEEAFLSEPSYKRKGIGTIVYLAMAKRVYEYEGLLLQSDRRLSQTAKRLWEKLVSMNLARYNVTKKIYIFNESALESNWLNGLLEIIEG